MYATLSTTLWADSKNSLTHKAILAVIGSAFLALSAKFSIPFVPVPFTMQTFAVLVIGMAFGWRLGMATVLLYLAEGAMGLPVFTSGAGLAYMAGPTGGYLAGFVLAAGLCGYLAERGWDRNVKSTAVAMTVGTAVILGMGYLWLGTLIGYDKALTAGVIPFIPGAVVKITLACATLPLAWKLIDKK